MTEGYDILELDMPLDWIETHKKLLFAVHDHEHSDQPFTTITLDGVGDAEDDREDNSLELVNCTYCSPPLPTQSFLCLTGSNMTLEMARIHLRER